MRVLVFDINVTGHHCEYLLHLMRYVYVNKMIDDYVFVVNSSFLSVVERINSDAEYLKGLNIVALSDHDSDYAYIENNLYRAMVVGRLVSRYANLYCVREVLLMSVNMFILPLILFRPKYEVRGIYFAPYIGMEANGFNDKIRYFRKQLQTKLLQLNKRVKSLYVLNDYDGCEMMNKQMRSKKFVYLPDPIVGGKNDVHHDIRNEYKIGVGKKIFLHFGSLSLRKGIVETLDCIQYIEPDVLGQICFIFAGKLDCGIEELVSEKILKYRRMYGADIITDFSFVTDEKKNAYFSCSDVIMIPYKNIESSSGVLGYAALYKKIVVGPEKGLLGSLIKEYGMGFTINIITAKSIADVINKMLLNGYYCPEGAEKYVKERSPEKFCEVFDHKGFN